MISVTKPISQIGDTPPIDIGRIKFDFGRQMPRRLADDLEPSLNGRTSREVISEALAILAVNGLLNICDSVLDVVKAIFD